jgi:putative ABC transport system permease protein
MQVSTRQLRALGRSRPFALGVVFTVALGLGANISVSAALDRLLLRPLPYGEPNRLVQIQDRSISDDYGPRSLLPYSLTLFLAREASAFESVDWAFGPARAVHRVPGDVALMLAPVTAGTLRTLRVPLLLGRDFAVDDVTGVEEVVVLTRHAWKTHFGDRHDVIGQAWKSGAFHYRVIGVLPEGFLLPSSRLLERVDGLLLFERRHLSNTPGLLMTAPFARMRSDTSIAAARQEVERLARIHRDTNVEAQSRRPPISIVPLQTGLVLAVAGPLWLCMASAWLLAILAVVNVMALVLFRAKEISPTIRLLALLGSSPLRLAATAALEVALLTGMGAGIAMWLAVGIHELVLAWLPGVLRPYAVAPSDWRVLSSALIGTVVASVAIGGVAGRIAATSDPSHLVRQRPGDTARGPAGPILIALAAAVSTVFVVLAAAYVPPLLVQLTRSVGFEPADLYVADINHGGVVPETESNESAGRPERVRRIRAVLQDLPGVDAVSIALNSPFTADTTSPLWSSLGLRGREVAMDDRLFATARIRLVAGRTFGPLGVEDATNAVLLDESGVEAIWPGIGPSSAVGREIALAGISHEVIGVAADTVPIGSPVAVPTLYRHVNHPAAVSLSSALVAVVRMEPGRALLGRDVTTALNGAFAANTVSVVPLSQRQSAARQLPMTVAAFFGALATIAVVTGLVGLRYALLLELRWRRRELAIRLALGARTLDMVKVVSSRLLAPMVLGTVAGGGAAYWLGASVQTALPNASAINAFHVLGGSGVACMLAQVTIIGPLWAFRRTSLALSLGPQG